MPKIAVTEEEMEKCRSFLKGDLWTQWGKLERDQKKKIPSPPIQKPCPKNARLIDLILPEKFSIGQIPLIDAISKRRSHRFFTDESFTLEELSFLLWTTQGIQYLNADCTSTLRTVPSGGARHPFETYVHLGNVDGLKKGLYRYLALEHKLYLIREESEYLFKIEKTLVARAPIVFFWTVIPYRTEWRYSLLSPKIIAQDSGHLCQNLYLASESIGAGTCAVGAYNQKMMDEFLGVDGKDEFGVYSARVGKIDQDKTSKILEKMGVVVHKYETKKH